MSSNNCNFFITNTLLFIHLALIIGNCNAGACPALISTTTRNVTCRYNNETLNSCMTPKDGTEAFLSCNEFYEEGTIEENPNRLCMNGKWDGPIPECYPICGVKGPNVSLNRSADIQDVLKYPWHVGVYNHTKNLICEGTLVAMNLVLTAASCISYEYNSTIYLRREIYIASGKIHPQYIDKRDKFAQHSKVNKIDIPANYKGSVNSYAFDVAVLTLKDPFLPSQVVQPACINLDNSSYNSKFKDNGTETSWSLTKANKTTILDVLRVMPVVYEQYSVCHAHHTDYYNITFDKTCSNSLYKEDACHGDSGASLVLNEVINDRYYIVGMRSNQMRLIKQCDQRVYREYTLLSHHTEFLQNHIIINHIRNCQLPRFPSHGEYTYINRNDRSAYELGYSVPSNSTLTLTCNINYTFTSPNATQFICSKNGKWIPNLTGCSPQTIVSGFNSPQKDNNYTTFIAVAIGVIIVITIIALILVQINIKKRRKIKRELQLAGLYHFQQGDLERFNPELGIGNQAELLPYNYKFEFPCDKIKLGKQLGSGAFGIVMKAEAFGIISTEEKTTVAVKMVKDSTDNNQLKSLISELKVIIHLGQHLNIVNLLGACTKNIIKRELLVIVEYCPFGNLHDYLLQNRINYVNQVNSATGTLDYSIDCDVLENGVSISNDPRDKNSGSSTIFNNTNKPESGLNYLENNEKSVKLISTKDLVSWSFQVARGMEYLSSRKVIHGDLAARNILLAENNIVKICDFGLAKRLYHNPNYKTKNDIPLPIKWMAIESIRDGVFSTESDVWSYGIVLWEFFSLAASPYPGMETDERIYYKLKNGYRMESPIYAPNEMYQIMCDCWEINPTLRPSFGKLAAIVGLMLEENVRQHYIDLNDPYFIVNTERLNKGEKDYLAILGLTDNNYNKNKDAQTDSASVASSRNLYTTPPYLTVNNNLKVQNENTKL